MSSVDIDLSHASDDDHEDGRDDVVVVGTNPVSYTHFLPHETKANLVRRLLLEKNNF